MQINAISIRKLKIKRIYNPSLTFMPADEFMLNSMKNLYDTDDFLLGRPSTVLTFEDGVWWWRDRLYVPKSMRNLILERIHDSPTAGHWGTLRTLDLLYCTFGWPNARADVLLYIKQCQSCQAVKVDHRPPQGKMIPLPVPD